MRAAGDVVLSTPLVDNCAGVCEAFSQELNGLISPSVAWISVTKRHRFLEQEVVSWIGDLVLRALSMPPGSTASGEEDNASVVGEADSQDGAGSELSLGAREETQTLPAGDLDSDVSTEAWHPEGPPPSDDENCCTDASLPPSSLCAVGKPCYVHAT